MGRTLKYGLGERSRGCKGIVSGRARGPYERIGWKEHFARAVEIAQNQESLYRKLPEVYCGISIFDVNAMMILWECLVNTSRGNF